MKTTFTSLVLAGSLLVAPAVLAQTTAKQGMDAIKSNLGNSKANLGEYQTNLKVVEKNLGEISKAKIEVEGQRKAVAASAEENNRAVQKITVQEKELAALLTDEKNKKAAEEKKIQELQAMITKLADNAQKRDANIADYESQMNQLQEEKKIWASRGDQIKSQSEQVIARTRALEKTENDWRNKKKGYEGEVNRWTKEVDRQQKLHDNYSSLAAGE